MTALKFLAFTTVLALVSGCGGDESPMSPDTQTPPPEAGDVPLVPVPTGPNQDVAARSESVTMIRPVIGAFSPVVVAAPWQTIDVSGTFTPSSRVCSIYDRLPAPIEGRGSNVILGGQVNFSTSVMCAISGTPIVNLPFTTHAYFRPGVARLWSDGQHSDRGQSYGFASTTSDGTYQISMAWTWTKALAEVPHLKRVRTWVLSPFADGSNVKSVDGAGSVTVTARHSTGVITSSTESWGRTLGGEVGIPGVITIGGTLSESFEQTVEISAFSEVETSTTIQGISNVLREARAWGLEEVYTVVDPWGTVYDDPNYDFNLGQPLVRHGVETRLVVSDFPR